VALASCPKGNMIKIIFNQSCAPDRDNKSININPPPPETAHFYNYERCWAKMPMASSFA